MYTNFVLQPHVLPFVYLDFVASWEPDILSDSHQRRVVNFSLYTLISRQ